MMDDTRALTILIVDDSATDRAIIRGMLGEYNTLTAADGRQAMDILDGKPGVDLMILDLNMPVMDGFQVLEAMRGNDRYKDVRTIILTDYEAIDKEIRGLELGAVLWRAGSLVSNKGFLVLYCPALCHVPPALKGQAGRRPQESPIAQLVRAPH